MEQKIINSFDGTPISVRVWDEVILPKGVIQISHDIGEHSGRYIEFATYLQNNGYIVFCPDQRAFGLTEPKDGIGYHDGDVFNDTISDAIFLNKYFSREYALPVLIVGFGYGGYVTQAVLKSGISIVGAIISSSGYNGVLYNVIRSFFTKSLPKKNKCLLYNSKVSSYNKRFLNEKGSKLWLTSNNELRQELLSDPLCGSTVSNNFYSSFSDGLSKLQKDETFPTNSKKTPIAFFCGRKDPNIGNNASSVIKIYKKFRKLGFSTVRLFIYENARHSILCETDRACYMSHMLTFINRCF